MDEAVAFRYWKVGNLARRIVDHLIRHLRLEGFHVSDIDIKMPDEASYRLEKIPESGEYNLVGDWLDERGRKLGSLIFHPDGRFIVEHEVVKPHPTMRNQLIVAVSAWGQGDEVTAESRLQPVLETSA